MKPEEKPLPTKAANGNRPRLRLLYILLQTSLWIVLPLLMMLYLLYAVETQSGPVYRWVSGTPVERLSLDILPLIWRHKTFLERQAMNSELSSVERQLSKQLFQRMEHTRPTHVIQLQDGTYMFGQPGESTATTLNLVHYENNRRCIETVQLDQVKSHTPLTMGHSEFTPKNIRFLLSHPNLNHYYLHPYLLVSEVPFSSAMELYGVLAILEDQFRVHFGPLITQPEDAVVQVAYFRSRESLVRRVAPTLKDIPNASAFFSKLNNTLYLHQNPPLENPMSAHIFRPLLFDDVTDRSERKAALHRVIRHEGAHHLMSSMGVFAELRAIPFWLEEGLSQYCETSPFDSTHPEKLSFLFNVHSNGGLLHLDTLLNATQEKVATLSNSMGQLYYAQSWLLFYYLMQEKRRPQFFAFLLLLNESGNWDAHHKIELANSLKTTWERIEAGMIDLLNRHESHEKRVPSG